jgi:uncharacterized protein (DUF2147 family)
MKSLKMLSVFFLLVAFSTTTFAQDQLCKVWYNQEKTSKLEVYLTTAGTYAAKIVWLKEPIVDGKPRTDVENPDAAKKNTPIMGMVVLKGLKKSATDPNFYEGGKIYDPKNGKTYDCRLTYKGKTAELRGYVMGMPFLGRTSVWTLAE